MLANYSEEEFNLLIEKEKQRAAYHEVCHVTVITHFGGSAHARIWPSGSDDPSIRSWRGQCQIICAPGTVAVSKDMKACFGIESAPKNWKVLVGLAGIAGEYLMAGIEDPETIYYEWDSAKMTDEISDTDLKMVGDQHKLCDVAKVVGSGPQRHPDSAYP